MSKRRATREHRCPRCQINRDLCFCEYITKIENRTPVVVVMHWREKWLTSNTTNLALNSLSRIETLMRGVKDQPIGVDAINKTDFSPIYLFPSESATLLTPESLSKLDKPPLLVVPDGTWSQAIKFHRREEALKGLPHYKLPYMGDSRYRLRKGHFKEALSTVEAIARALGIVESIEIQSKLEAMLEVMVERVLTTRL